MADNIDIRKEAPALSMVVDDGIIEVPIYNKLGDQIGAFYFNPSDAGMVDRYNEVASDFASITEPLEHINIDENGETSEDGSTAALALAKEKLFEACNYIFGGNFAEAFFGKVHPFSPINGKFYCENALEAVGNFISRCFDGEVKKINARVQKYTHGYAARTGKHRDGKK